MTSNSSILFKCLVKPFYRENAGTFFFFATVMIFSVGLLNGASLIDYHYSLIMGILTSGQFLALVCLCWLMYVRKLASFVAQKFADPQFAFLQLLNGLHARKRFRLLLRVQLWLLSPILVYGAIMIGISFYHHFFLSACFLLLFFAGCLILPTQYYTVALRHPTRQLIALRQIHYPRGLRPSYVFVLARQLVRKEKFLLLGIKAFTCIVLFGMLTNNTTEDYDINFPFLFFNFGIIANGIVIYRLRTFEETQLLFYRNLPVGVAMRWLQYLILYAALCVPELISISMMVPIHLQPQDAINFMCCGYALLLLMNSIAFLDDFTMKGYLRVMLVILCIQYFFVIAGALGAMAVALFLASGVIFFTNYHSFEKGRGQIGQ